MRNCFEVDHDGLRRLLKDLDNVTSYDGFELWFEYVYVSEYSTKYKIKLTRKLRKLMNKAGYVGNLNRQYGSASTG